VAAPRQEVIVAALLERPGSGSRLASSRYGIMSGDMEASAQAGMAPKTTVATYENYTEAERAVDFLSDRGFPVERVAIVGTGLRTVEQVAGRLTTGRAALVGGGQGAMVGLLFGLLFGLFFSGPAFFGVVLYGLVAGAVFGAILGALTQAARGGRRDFASVRGMEAERYEVQVEHEHSTRAKQLLTELDTAAASPTPAS
jgi:hypothetical protein